MAHWFGESQRDSSHSSILAWNGCGPCYERRAFSPCWMLRAMAHSRTSVHVVVRLRRQRTNHTCSLIIDSRLLAASCSPCLPIYDYALPPNHSRPCSSHNNSTDGYAGWSELVGTLPFPPSTRFAKRGRRGGAEVVGEGLRLYGFLARNHGTCLHISACLARALCLPSHERF